MTEAGIVPAMHQRTHEVSAKLAHFADASLLLDRLELRQLERRGLDRRGALERGECPTAENHAQLARQLCHDMRQPLAVIAAVIAELESELPPSNTGRRRLDQLLEQTERLSQFVAGCLSAPKQVEVDLQRVVDGVVRSAAVTFEGTLHLVCGDQPVVRGDAVLLDRVFTNLLDNACRAAGPDGLVRVVLWSAPDGVHVDIDDDGPGLELSGPREGRGLGLVIVQSVLDQHGGTLSFGGGALGGTGVRIRLPLVSPTEVGPCPR